MNEIAERPEANISLENARALVVSSNEDFRAADEFQITLQKLEKAIVSDFENPKQKAAEAHRAICAQEKRHLAPVQEARKILKQKMSSWADEQERLRREEEARLQEQARKQEEDRKLAQAALAEKAGDREEAEAIINEPVQAPLIMLPKTTPKTQTIVRKVFDFQLVDEKSVKRDYLQHDAVKIGKLVRSVGMAAEEIVGGIRVFQKTV